MSIQRTKLATDWQDNYLDILKDARANRRTPARHLQAISPMPEGNNPNEPVSALGWVLDYHGVILRDNRAKGIVSTPVEEIFDEPHKAHAFSAAIKASITGGIRSHNEQELAFGSADYNPGSAFRPYSRAPMVDANRKVSWPPTEAVIASVREQKDIQIPVYVPNEDVEKGKRWQPGTPIPLGLLTTTEDTVSTRWYADGISISGELRSANADLVMMHADKRRVELEQMIVDQALNNANAISPMTLAIGGSADGDRRVARAFTRNAFEITSIFAEDEAYDRYLGYDRSGYAYSGGNLTPAGQGSSIPVPGRVAPNPVVYEITVPNIDDESALAIDASEAIDLYIAPGSEEETDTYVERNRAYEIAWSIRWVTALRYPSPEVEKANIPIRMLTGISA